MRYLLLAIGSELSLRVFSRGLIRMSELYENLPVLTVDESAFRVYRRNKRDVIPIVCPPRR